ncbi:hypothetical protein [Metabacillus sediminilitoris]|uniref:Uncharacterized protein n=1 Tax=Metabacillus sediminilitoris TaxID=2567941 RepID=A0A4S4BSX7_9BACI|nr:hypothetical protein [Metabacillus sediminilitoris]QGQ44166.1 hypothetical protein GMB29_01940 [Metabacillus sediminilitoris]THF78130.1 hypothetical protein E6W99_16350 [Metabacillus sediminilitoris]
MNDFTLIKVERIETSGKKNLIIDNPTKLKQIVKGSQGAVFQISEDRFVGIYVNPNAAIKEGKALEAAKDLNIVPQLFEVGLNYALWSI